MALPGDPPNESGAQTPAVPESGDLGFQNQNLAEREAGAAIGVHQAEAELRAMIIVARRFPRNEAAAAANLIKSCKRPGFAEVAAYSFPRAGNRIIGPSVAMAREACRLWGNIRKGLRIVSIDEEYVHIKAIAHDTQTNQYEEAEDKFAKLIERKKPGGGTHWIVPDERDLRELINRRGAICERNAALKILPKDLIEEAMRETHETMRKAAAGEVEQDKAAAVRRLVLAFDGVGVNPDMLIARIGHTLELITVDEATELRQILNSLTDGNSKREEYFAMPGAPATGPEKLQPKVKGKADLSGVKEGAPPPPHPDEAQARIRALEAQLAEAKEKEAQAAVSPGEKVDKGTGEVTSEEETPPAEGTPTTLFGS